MQNTTGCYFSKGGKALCMKTGIVSNPQLIMLQLLSTHHPWVNRQRNPCFIEKKAINSNQLKSSLILLIS
jgi:hypothetical protein